jgi:hypothetical protein
MLSLTTAPAADSNQEAEQRTLHTAAHRCAHPVARTPKLQRLQRTSSTHRECCAVCDMRACVAAASAPLLLPCGTNHGGPGTPVLLLKPPKDLSLGKEELLPTCR